MVNSILMRDAINKIISCFSHQEIKLNSVAGTADYVLSWQSKGLFNESIKPRTTTNNSLTPELNYYATKTKVKFTGSCLKQSSHIYTHK